MTSSTPKYIGTVRKPIMPMSWKQGSQLSMTSLPVGSILAPTNIASALEWMLRWVICTAFGEPVDPDVSCISARSSSPVSTGSIGSASSSSATVTVLMPFSASTGAAAMNGSEMMTTRASIISTTVRVSRPTPPGRCAGSAGAAWSGWRRASTAPGRPGRSPPGRRRAHRRRRRARPRWRPGPGDAAGPLVHLQPGVAHRRVRLTGHHALAAFAGIAEHCVGKPAHDNLLAGPGFLMVHPAGHAE